MHIKFFSLIKLDLKKSNETIIIDNKKTVKEIIRILDNRYDGYFSEKLYDDDNNMLTGTIIMVNGENIHHLNGLNTEVVDNDRMVLFPPSAGG